MGQDPPLEELPTGGLSLLSGRLLVALPQLRDPNFDRTVVLVLEHNEEGALGLVLNRPSQTEVSDPLPRWGDLSAPPPVVFVGGPVAPGAAICLARAAKAVETAGFKPLFGRLGTLDLSMEPNEVGVELEMLRVFSGYAGWGSGQLEAEIAAGAWLMVDLHPDDPLHPYPEDLWKLVLRRQKGSVSMLAAYPADPQLN
ncbi:MAG: YqgE/AlgH family protein [Actinobacteria bacterium]|nr:YqgE/AlgH family protein [Actinomycetota bacterium]